MTKADENRKLLKVKLLGARLKSYQVRIKGLHKRAINLNPSQPQDVQQFLDSTANLATLRKEFNDDFDELQLFKMELDEESESDISVLTCFESLFVTVQSRVNALSPALQSNVNHGPSIKPTPKIKLPPIELPKFDGDTNSWPMFIECFNNTIHNNPQLSNTERVYYLCGQLRGRALKCIAGINPTGDNYDLIYDTLVSKYEDVRSMGTCCLDEIMNLRKIAGPSADGLNSFIEKFSVSVSAFHKLDIPEKAKIMERTGDYSASGTSKHTVSSNRVASSVGCPICQRVDHQTFSRCADFLELSARERFDKVKNNNGCVLCLNYTHESNACSIKGNCNVCHSKSHHTLLHFGNSAGQPSTSLPVANGDVTAEVGSYDCALGDAEEGESADVGVTLCSLQDATERDTRRQTRSSTVLLATAQVRVVDAAGKAHLVRCLVDNGSQNHFITKRCCERLSLTPRSLSSPMSVSGFGGSSNPVIRETELVFSSRFDRSRPYKVRPLVVDNITQKLPTTVVDRSMLSYLKDVPLADHTFDRPGETEMLIGAQLFARLMLPKRIYGPPGRPDAVQTTLGYILMGEAPVLEAVGRQDSLAFCAFSAPRLDEAVRSFWELEEVPSCTSARLSREEQECENLFKVTTTRDSTGRYIVALPFKSDPANLGDSLQTAEKRFYALEKKLERSPQLRCAYDEVINEYLRNDYLEPVPKGKVSYTGYVIPHHGVIRNDKVSTKLRVVLDASAKTSNNLSLNNVLHAGPNLQGDIFKILLNFRLFPVAFCADVRQMYLQIKMEPSDVKRILYRFHTSEELQLFEFKRLCFGLSVSPFLALRTVRQLCEDEGYNCPVAVEVVRRDLYMDDVVSSESSPLAAKEAALQLIRLFKAGGFDLMKWSSNSSELLSHLPATHLHPQVVKFGDAAGQKILGVKWDPRTDMFSFEISPCDKVCTKRNILSAVAKLWDILGFAAPVILYAKLMIQELWALKIDWDEMPPQPIIDKWNKFQLELPLLARMNIPRHIGVTEGVEVTLLAFSDASERAYGVVLYLHIRSERGVAVQLLCAKSRVAPVKSLTLARLELCRALLLSKLVKAVLLTYESRWKINQVYAFTDSTVTLHWIHSSPHRWKTFVANRVAQIQENVDPKCFYHIAGKENPSDYLSRGLTPAQLIEHPLWLTGPPWVAQDVKYWPVQPFNPTNLDVPEAKQSVVLVTTNPVEPVLYQLAQRISSWPKLTRIVVYLLRFARKLRSSGPIAINDLIQAELAIIRSVQAVHFANAIEAVRMNKTCAKSLQRLRPILVDEVLRVGGRLEGADLTFDHKHPILLPRKDHIVNLIIDETHRKNCHTGPHLLLSILRQRFWILAGRNIVRSRVHLCNVCFRTRPKPCSPPVMADLPECRLQVSKPFAHTGLDYCGPFQITYARRRGSRSQKAYICVFICLTTRAVHVELVPDLSTDSFLNALKRFLARRGPVERLMSDHGTNFMGARAYLDELYSFLQSDVHTQKWGNEMVCQRISWQMIPPNAPHFGGEWESAVKAFKKHLLRVIGAQILTYEELLTVLCQVEAVLNSRPLGRAISSDPSEPLALTPAHFLHTTPLRALPSAPVSEDRISLSSRYLLLDQLVQSYWRRWSLEYLHTLQGREKWVTDTAPIEKGTVVIMMQNNAPPLHWPLGVVLERYPGTDRRNRVVLVRTRTGTFTRPVVRLCPLPLQ